MPIVDETPAPIVQAIEFKKGHVAMCMARDYISEGFPTPECGEFFAQNLPRQDATLQELGFNETQRQQILAGAQEKFKDALLRERQRRAIESSGDRGAASAGR